jgi:hypothetical protein
MMVGLAPDHLLIEEGVVSRPEILDPSRALRPGMTTAAA